MVDQRSTVLTGAEELRRAAALFSNCNESFNCEHSAAQLLTLWRMYTVSGYDITPDRWSPRQVAEALEGRAPKWDENLRAVYT